MSSSEWERLSHVWTTMATGNVECFDFDGKSVWKLNLQDRYGPFTIQFGMASTPVLDGNSLYFQLIHGERFVHRSGLYFQ